MRTLLLALVLVAGCSKKKEGEGDKPATQPATTPKTEEAKPKTDPAPDEKPTPTEPSQPAGAPSKEAAIQHLKDLNAALEAKDWKKAVTFMAPFPGMPPEKMEEQIGKLAEIKEISAKGIDILAAKGKWGKLSEVFPEKAERWAQKAGVPADQTWGFSYENAEVGMHWDGKAFKVIRLDDVGKLEQ